MQKKLWSAWPYFLIVACSLVLIGEAYSACFNVVCKDIQAYGYDVVGPEKPVRKCYGYWEDNKGTKQAFDCFRCGQDTHCFEPVVDLYTCSANNKTVYWFDGVASTCILQCSDVLSTVKQEASADPTGTPIEIPQFLCAYKVSPE